MKKNSWGKRIKKRFKKRFLVAAGGLVLVLSLLFNLFQYQKIQKLEAKNIVVKVIDGDTFVLETGIRVRLRDVDAPPLDLCGGREAKEKLEELILNKKVRFEDESIEGFRRIITFVFVNNQSVGVELLKEGWARFDGHVGSSQGESLKAAYELAMKEERGVFSPLCRQKENPDNPECLIKGNIDKKFGEKIYHFPGCSEYQQTIVEKDLGEQWFCTEKEAQKAGYKKATNCFGKSFK